jgi:hypothetical protein
VVQAVCPPKASSYSIPIQVKKARLAVEERPQEKGVAYNKKGVPNYSLEFSQTKNSVKIETEIFMNGNDYRSM